MNRLTYAFNQNTRGLSVSVKAGIKFMLMRTITLLVGIFNLLRAIYAWVQTGEETGQVEPAEQGRSICTVSQNSFNFQSEAG